MGEKSALDECFASPPFIPDVDAAAAALCFNSSLAATARGVEGELTTPSLGAGDLTSFLDDTRARFAEAIGVLGAEEGAGGGADGLN